MNRRQRRKNRAGEFVQYGFQVDAVFIPGRPRPVGREPDPFCDALIAFVEKHGLGYGGSGGSVGGQIGETDAMSGYIERYRKNGHGRWGTIGCTAADRTLIERWLCARVEIATVTVGLLEVIR